MPSTFQVAGAACAGGTHSLGQALKELPHELGYSGIEFCREDADIAVGFVTDGYIDVSHGFVLRRRGSGFVSDSIVRRFRVIICKSGAVSRKISPGLKPAGFWWILPGVETPGSLRF